ncbi:MAG TPA: hypothetical protein VN493_22205 [Thermoanaerobaculia bacterium]|nr:hypothetical protein [Thermoanaerobaculia bacterium]
MEQVTDRKAIHPDPEQIERFILGQSSREESRLVARHLLRACPECQKLALAASIVPLPKTDHHGAR